MSMTQTATATTTYSTADVENVVKNFSADLRMIAESSGTWSRDKVNEYVADIQYMAKNKYLKFVDVTLLHQGIEQRAARYLVNENSGEITASRPGGVMWPRLISATLRIVVQNTAKWKDEPPDRTRFKLAWQPTSDDISHSTLKSEVGRAFTSNAYGFERKDFTK